MKSNLIVVIAFVLSFSNTLSFAQVWDEIAKQLPTPYEEPMASSFFGCSIDVDGDYAVVGAYGFDGLAGRAIVYHFNGTEWEREANLRASNYVSLDRFGYSVSIDGDQIVVGARSNAFMGAAYVFSKPTTGWSDTTETAILTSSDLANNDNYGVSVAVSGDNIVVGADQDDDNGSNSGSVYVFTKPGANWIDMTETAKLLPSDGSVNDNFGQSVAIDGDNVVVGSPTNGAGASYVFTNPGTGWVNAIETAKLTTSDALSGDKFGSSVSIDGINIAAGSPGDDDNGSASGSVYVFTKQGANWINATETAKLLASDGQADDNFGNAVDLKDGQIIVGASQVDDNGDNAGSAYIFEEPGTGWVNATETAELSASNGVADDNHGYSVSVSGNHVLVGAFLVDQGAYTSTGAFYAYEKPGTTWVTAVEDQIVLGIYYGAVRNLFGFSVAVQGKYSVVGAREDSELPGISGHGAIYVFEFDGSNWVKIAKLLLSNAQGSEKLGCSVDIDGNTIVAGAFNTGATYVYEKPTSGWADMTETAILTASDASSYDEFGISVGISGDDIVVGARRKDVNDTDEGAVYVYTKTGNNWTNMTETAKLTASDGATEDYLGYAVDIDGDHIVAGAFRDDINTINEGSVYVFNKPSGGWVNSFEDAKLTGSNLTGYDYFGCSVSISDSTIVVGARQELFNPTGPGYAFVFVRTGANWVTSTEDAILSASDGHANAAFGHSVSFDGDRIVVGASFDGENGVQSGAAYVFDKPTSGWIDMTETEKILASDGVEGANFGQAVAISNNVIIVGADRESELEKFAGAAYLYLDCSPVYNTFSIVACDSLVSPSGNYTWYTGGTYNDTVSSMFGCDSILTINFTLGVEQYANLSMTNCDSLVSPSGLYTWTANGTYNDTILTVSGCDSIMTIDVTIINTSYGNSTISACESYTVPSGDETYTTSGVYRDTLINAVGCDSLITIDLTILQPTSGTDIQTSCNSFVWIDGNTYTETVDTVTYTLTNTAGCDSVVTLDLTIDFLDITVINSSPELLAVANGASYQWLDCDGNMMPISGETDQIFTASQNGNYAVEITKNGCSDTSQCHLVNNVGITSFNVNNSSEIYPNPTAGLVNVELEKKHLEVDLVVLDALGKVMHSGSYESIQEFVFQLPEQPGIYFVHILSSQEIMLIERIVKL